MITSQQLKYTLLIGVCIGIHQSAVAEDSNSFLNWFKTNRAGARSSSQNSNSFLDWFKSTRVGDVPPPDRSPTGTATYFPGQRVALVIGNSAYQHPDTLPKLSNPTNDAEDISQALRRFGFTVIVGKDWNKEQMETAVTEFAIQARGAAAALFYYSGHGIQIKNQNYLMPIEASVKSEVQTHYQGVQLNYVLDEMDNANSAVKIAILDACRSNSFTGKFRASVQRGLARAVAASKNTVIVYATEPGNVASDGEGQNGVFTAGLLKALQGQDLSLDGVLTQTSAEVEQATHGQQTPFVDGPKLLQKRFVFAPSTTVPEVSGTVGVSSAAMEAARQQVAAAQQEAAEARAEAQKLAEQIRLAEQARKEAEQARAEMQKLAEQARLAEEARKQAEAAKQAAEQARLAEEAKQAELKKQQQRQSFEPEMVDIPAGSFKMGSPKNEKGRSDDEGPVHTVHINAFQMGKYEVTQSQWQAVMGNNPSNFKDCSDCPVESVSWNDVQDYIAKLNVKTSKTYRLPTEAEWEYACRGGAKSERYCGGNDIEVVAWYRENSGIKPYLESMSIKTSIVEKFDMTETHPVGGKAANGFGLYDMSGNVSEWNQDRYNDSYKSAATNGSAWELGDNSHLLRGGSWGSPSVDCRAASRSHYDDTSSRDGFRVVVALPPSARAL